MQITNTFQFDQSADDIYKYFTDENLIIEKIEALGARNIQVELKIKKKKTEVIVTREVAIELPGPLKKFAQPWNSVTQKETWTQSNNGSYLGEMEIITEGIPLSVFGQMEIKSTKNGSEVAVVTDLNSKIPFLGKTITKFAAQASLAAVDEELEYIAKNA